MGLFDEAAGCYDKAMEINRSSKEFKAEVLYGKSRSLYYQGKAENDTALINSSYDIYKNAVEMGYILGDTRDTEDGSPFGERPPFEIRWKWIVHPRMSTWAKTRELRRFA
jgi:tetratricopeptide (TPR) repeat protein